MRIALWTRKLSLKISKGVDHVACFECPVASADIHLAKDPSVDESIDSLIGGAVTSAEERGGSVCGDDRNARQRTKQKLCCRVGPDRTKLCAPRVDDTFGPSLKLCGVLNGAGTGGGESSYPDVRSLASIF